LRLRNISGLPFLDAEAGLSALSHLEKLSLCDVGSCQPMDPSLVAGIAQISRLEELHLSFASGLRANELNLLADGCPRLRSLAIGLAPSMKPTTKPATKPQNVSVRMPAKILAKISMTKPAMMPAKTPEARSEVRSDARSEARSEATPAMNPEVRSEVRSDARSEAPVTIPEVGSVTIPEASWRALGRLSYLSYLHISFGDPISTSMMRCYLDSNPAPSCLRMLNLPCGFADPEALDLLVSSSKTRELNLIRVSYSPREQQANALLETLAKHAHLLPWLSKVILIPRTPTIYYPNISAGKALLAARLPRCEVVVDEIIHSTPLPRDETSTNKV